MIFNWILSYQRETYFWTAKDSAMNILRWIHTFYAAIIFALTFLVVFPIFLVCALNKKWHKTAYLLTHYWGHVYPALVGIKMNIEDRNKQKYQEPCVFVANHFSYADIASIPAVAKYACFIGKQSIKKVPLFGFYFSSLHITLNRESTRNRAHVLQKGIAALEEGKSIVIFPEGGIRTKNPPNQADYKDGGFIMALKSGVPIVPITLPTNYKMLPDDGKLFLRGNKLNIVVHEAIDCSKMELTDLQELKEKVFGIIQQELDSWSLKEE